MANPICPIVMALTAAVTNGIALSQSRGSAGNLTINGSLASGGVATLTSTYCKARRVGITSAGNDSGITWTITGLNRYGFLHSETLAGANVGTANSVKDYATVTKIASSGATASTVTAGTTTSASSAWQSIDIMREVISVGIGLQINGTATATVEYTFDDPNASIPGSIEPASSAPPIAWPSVLFTNVTAALTSGALNFPVFATRLTITSGTGTVTMQQIQSGIGS